MLKNILTLSAVLFLSSLSFGSTTCQSTFHAGSGQTAFNFCVTENGNIAYLNIGVAEIQDGAEGYAICGGSNYWDLGLYGDSGNWQASVITQPGGPGTFPLTITRTTSDFNLVFTQQFSIGSGGKSVHVKMTATGLGSKIMRFAHVPTPQSHADASTRTAFILNGNGLMASPAITTRVVGLILAGSAPSNICNQQTIETLPYFGDAAIVLLWDLVSKRKNSVSFDYVPMR